MKSVLLILNFCAAAAVSQFTNDEFQWWEQRRPAVHCCYCSVHQDDEFSLTKHNLQTRTTVEKVVNWMYEYVFLLLFCCLSHDVSVSAQRD